MFDALGRELGNSFRRATCPRCNRRRRFWWESPKTLGVGGDPCCCPGDGGSSGGSNLQGSTSSGPGPTGDCSDCTNPVPLTIKITISGVASTSGFGCAAIHADQFNGVWYLNKVTSPSNSCCWRSDAFDRYACDGMTTSSRTMMFDPEYKSPTEPALTMRNPGSLCANLYTADNWFTLEGNSGGDCDSVFSGGFSLPNGASLVSNIDMSGASAIVDPV